MGNIHLITPSKKLMFILAPGTRWIEGARLSGKSSPKVDSPVARRGPRLPRAL